MWHRTLESRKVQSLSGDLFKSWCNLLMLATRLDKDGFLPSIEDIAYALRMSEDQAEVVTEDLVNLRFLDRLKPGLRIHDWGDWQLRSYLSTDRVREFRKRQKMKAETGETVSETFHGNVPGTFHETHETHLEENRREEKRKEPPHKLPPGGDIVISNSNTSLPDWIAPDDWADYESMRKSIRKPMTPRARLLAVRTLERLRAQGEEPAAVLQQSILQSWQGLFPVRPDLPSKNGHLPAKRDPPTPEEIAKGQAAVAAEIAKVKELAKRAKVSE
jgi:hypothetical protein